MPKILIVDDDPVMLGLLTTLLELEGYEVLTVTKPESIVPMTQAENPVFILMDYNLSGGNSMDALRKLKNDPLLKTIPILMASGMDCRYECSQAGADSFILKPFRPAELLARISEMLSGNTDAEATH